MKEAEEKISVAEVMTLPNHSSKFGLIKCTAVYINYVSCLAGLTFLKVG